MEVYLKKVIGFLSSLVYDAETISKILGVSVEVVKEFIPIISNANYSNCNNHKKDKSPDVEVLITNY